MVLQAYIRSTEREQVTVNEMAVYRYSRYRSVDKKECKTPKEYGVGKHVTEPYINIPTDGVYMIYVTPVFDSDGKEKNDKPRDFVTLVVNYSFEKNLQVPENGTGSTYHLRAGTKVHVQSLIDSCGEGENSPTSVRVKIEMIQRKRKRRDTEEEEDAANEKANNKKKNKRKKGHEESESEADPESEASWESGFSDDEDRALEHSELSKDIKKQKLK